MAPKKRLADHVDFDGASSSKTSSRKARKSNPVKPTATSTRPQRSSQVTKATHFNPSTTDVPTENKARGSKSSKSAVGTVRDKQKPTSSSTSTGDMSKQGPGKKGQDSLATEEAGGKQYWLMKAEPESRLENGVDVAFSIDHLKSSTEPEPWDGAKSCLLPALVHLANGIRGTGVRNYAARNNMCAMRKGDLAFFYHSNCKVPGIVGIMEIVREASVDESAFDEKHPYHDPKSVRDKPKWFVVHVKFRRKFSTGMPLTELRSFGGQGGVLESMQVLKTSRLSVSKVTTKEWDFIVGEIDSKGESEV